MTSPTKRARATPVLKNRTEEEIQERNRRIERFGQIHGYQQSSTSSLTSPRRRASAAESSWSTSKKSNPLTPSRKFKLEKASVSPKKPDPSASRPTPPHDTLNPPSQSTGKGKERAKVHGSHSPHPLTQSTGSSHDHFSMSPATMPYRPLTPSTSPEAVGNEVHGRRTSTSTTRPAFSSASSLTFPERRPSRDSDPNLPSPRESPSEDELADESDLELAEHGIEQALPCRARAVHPRKAIEQHRQEKRRLREQYRRPLRRPSEYTDDAITNDESDRIMRSLSNQYSASQISDAAPSFREELEDAWTEEIDRVHTGRGDVSAIGLKSIWRLY